LNDPGFRRFLEPLFVVDAKIYETLNQFFLIPTSNSLGLPDRGYVAPSTAAQLLPIAHKRTDVIAFYHPTSTFPRIGSD